MPIWNSWVVLSQTGFPKKWYLAGRPENRSLVAVFAGTNCRVLRDLHSNAVTWNCTLSQHLTT